MQHDTRRLLCGKPHAQQPTGTQGSGARAEERCDSCSCAGQRSGASEVASSNPDSREVQAGGRGGGVCGGSGLLWGWLLTDSSVAGAQAPYRRAGMSTYV